MVYLAPVKHHNLDPFHHRYQPQNHLKEKDILWRNVQFHKKLNANDIFFYCKYFTNRSLETQFLSIRYATSTFTFLNSSSDSPSRRHSISGSTMALQASHLSGGEMGCWLVLLWEWPSLKGPLPPNLTSCCNCKMIEVTQKLLNSRSSNSCIDDLNQTFF